MSTILAVETPLAIYLMADRRYTMMGGSTFQGSTKIFTVCEDLYITYTGSAIWDKWLLEVAENAPQRISNEELPTGPSVFELSVECERDRQWLFARRPDADELDGEQLPPTPIAVTPFGMYWVDPWTVTKICPSVMTDTDWPIAVASDGSGGDYAKAAFVSTLAYVEPEMVLDDDFIRLTMSNALTIAASLDHHTGDGLDLRVLKKPGIILMAAQGGQEEN